MNKYQKAIEVIDTLLHLMCGEEREDGYKPTMEEMSNSMDLLKDLVDKETPIKELGWLEKEKQEIKQETNFEHYKDLILDCCIDHLAVVKGIPKSCTKIDCNDCDFLTIQKECCEIAKDWLNQPYKKLTYKLNKFEFDLIQTYRDCHESCKLSEFKQLIELKDKGYFKDINLDLTIHEILDNCEVV